MPTLYIASTETFVGKSAVCMGLLHRMQQDGHTVGYMKPLSVQAQAGEEQDTALIKQTFHLPAAVDVMAPVLMTPSMIEGILHGNRISYVEQVQQAFATVASGTDIMIVEGSNSWAEGALIGLSAPRVIEMLNATSLLVSRYRGLHTVDIILSVKRYLPSQFSGVLLNQVERRRWIMCAARLCPSLSARAFPCWACCPKIGS